MHHVTPKVGARGSDDGFLNKALAKHAKHPNLEKPSPKQLDSQLCFNIKHYAATVAYNVTNFVDKNRDTLAANLVMIRAQGPSYVNLSSHLRHQTHSISKPATLMDAKYSSATKCYFDPKPLH